MIVVAGQVWKRPGVYATVTALRCDEASPDASRVLATLVEIELSHGCITRREISCRELEAALIQIYNLDAE